MHLQDLVKMAAKYLHTGIRLHIVVSLISAGRCDIVDEVAVERNDHMKRNYRHPLPNMILILLITGSACITAQTMVSFPVDWEKLPSGAVNLSYLLDRPAGRNGFITIRDGHFVQPGGERFRIWGVNLTGGACYPEKEDATRVAEMLASLGINAVRFHFLDSDWGADKSIFPYDTNTTRVLDPGQLDRLDYFVAQLAGQGIYSNFNLNVGRNYREGDQVPYHQYLGLAKAVTLFDDRIIELQKEYASMLLTHRNPYTGNEYRNEPSLAFLEIVNENSLVEAWFGGRLRGTHSSTRTGTWIDIPEYYAEELTRKYNDWLQKRLTRGELHALRQEAGVEKGDPVPRLDPDEFEGASDFRFHTEARFIIETEDNFYSGIYRFLKDSVRVSQLVAANSDHNHYKSGYALLSTTSKLDFVDGHVYWQHPSYGTDPETGERTFSIDNTPMVNDPERSTPVQLSRSAVAGMPYTVSETNHPYPNEYACEGIITLGAYALLQDWDGIYFYTFEHDDPSLWKDKIPRHFDILHDPAKLAGLVAGALMFHRADLEPAQRIVYRNYAEDELIEGIRKDPAPGPYFTPGFSQLIPLKYRTRIVSFSGGKNDYPSINTNSPVISQTGQLVWFHDDHKGLLVMDSDRTQGLTGFTKTMESQETRNMAVSIDNPFASVVISSMDGNPIERSGRMLLTTTSTSILIGARWNEERTSLEQWGELPFRIAAVTGVVRLKKLEVDGQLRITPLDGAGIPAGEAFSVAQEEGTYSISIGAAPTMWYLVEKLSEE